MLYDTKWREEMRRQDEHRARHPNCKCRDCDFYRAVTSPTIAKIRECFATPHKEPSQ